MNIDVKKHKQFLNNIPEFYKNVLTSWIKKGGGQLSSPLTFSNVRKQILWGKRFITYEKKYLFFNAELSVFKMSIQFFGRAFLRRLNSDIQLDLFFNL
jgi:hypothetical protein